MPTSREPTLSVSAPTANAVVGYTPFVVAGLVTAEGNPEPVEIDSVTVQVDTGPVVAASRKTIPNKTLTEVSFQASVQVIGTGPDPHTVTVVATADSGISATKTVEVIAGIFATAPAIVVDIITQPIPTAPPGPSDPSVMKLVGEVQKSLYGLASKYLVPADKILIGPNLVVVPTGPSGPVMRFGLWIENYNFPTSELVPPSTEYLLSQLTLDAATAGMNLVPLLTQPSSLHGDDGAITFSVPLTTFQQILDSVKPLLTQEAANHDYSLDSATITIDPSGQTDDSGGSITTSFSGSLPLDVPLTASLTETLGWRMGTGEDASGRYPTVAHTSTSVSVTSALDWFVGAFIPAGIEILLGAVIGIDYYASGLGSKAGGLLAGLLAEVPTRIPFSNADFPSALANLVTNLQFPTMVFNWTSFSPASDLSIGGAALCEIVERDQSMVQVTVTGPTELVYGSGDDVTYQVMLDNIYPDSDGLTWQAAGLGLVATGSVSANVVTQTGSFLVEFPLPSNLQPGKYSYSLTVSAHETCGSDPTASLTGSATFAVTLEIAKNAN